MSTHAVLTRFEGAPDALDEIARIIGETHSGLMAGQRNWMATDILIDRERSAVLLLTHWQGAPIAFDAVAGHETIYTRLGDRLAGQPESDVLEVVREREHAHSKEVDIAISGSLGD